MGEDSNLRWGRGRRQLPLNCEAEYFPEFMTATESSQLFDFLVENCDLSDRTVTIADGTVYQMDTGKFIFADAELTDHRHLPEVLGQRAAWAPPVRDIKLRLEALLSRSFRVCLVIRYRSGEVGAGLHTDMPEFGPVSFLTVISLGAARDFLFKSKENGDEYRVRLEPGSLLTMGEHCQERYEHGLPEDPACTEPRVSLSYRQFGWDT